MSSHVEPVRTPKVSQETEPRLRSNRSSSELWPGCQASTLQTNSVRAQSQAVKHFGKWKKNQLTSLGYIATHKLLARVRRFGESLEYFEFQVELSIIDMQFDTPSAVTPEMPNVHAPCLTLLIVGFASVQLLFLEHQIIARLPGLMPQQQKRKS